MGEGWGREACPGSIGGLNRGIGLGGVPLFMISLSRIGSSISLDRLCMIRHEYCQMKKVRNVTSLHRAAHNGAVYLTLSYLS